MHNQVRTQTGSDAHDTRGNGNPSECPDPVELILYVSAHSPHSVAAIENIRNVIKRLRPSRVRLTIHDLSKDPSQGDADGVTFTPTLVKRSAGPRTYHTRPHHQSGTADFTAGRM